MPYFHLLVKARVPVVFKNSRQIDFFDRKDVDSQVSAKTGNRLDYLYSLFREYHTIGDWTLDLKTGEARWSDEVYRIHGFKPADGPLPPDQVNSLIEMFEASDAKVVRKLVDAAAKTGQGYQFRLRLNARDGKTRLVESIGGAIKDENGEVVKLAGVFHDVTEDQAARAQADHLGKVLRIFTKHLPVLLAITDDKMNIVEVSDYWIKEFGLKRDSVKGKSYYDIFPDIPTDLRDIHRLALEGKPKRIQSIPISSDSGAPWYNWSIYPWFGVNGDVTGVLIASQRQKIEPQKMPARDIVAENQLLMLERAPSALLCMNVDTNMFSYANRAALQFLGLSFEEAVDELTADRVLEGTALEEIHRGLMSSSVCGPIEATIDCAAFGRRRCFVRASRMGPEDVRMLVLELSLAEQRQATNVRQMQPEPTVVRRPGLLGQLFGT